MLTLQPSADSGPRSAWLHRVSLAAMTIARFLLGIAMLPYAISKLFDFQFQVSAWNYARPLGEVSGKVLSWAMMGYSPHLQIFLGLLELVPALLLFSARTRRLGAVLLFPVILNVVLINFSLDLWPATRVISSVLLALNIFLLLYDLPLYLSILRQLLPPTSPIANRKLRYTAATLGFLIPAAAVADQLYETVHLIKRHSAPLADFIGVRQINRAGTFKIDQLTIDGKPTTLPPGSSLYFDFANNVVFGDPLHPSFGTYTADRDSHTFTLDKLELAGSASPIQGTYQVAKDKLALSGTRGGHPIALSLHQDNWGRLQ